MLNTGSIPLAKTPPTAINTRCKICDGEDFKFLYEGKDRLHFLEGAFDLYRCKGCGLIFVYPFLDEEALSKFYPQDYSPYHQTDTSAGPAAKAAGKLGYYLRHPFRFFNAVFYSKILQQNRDIDLALGAKVLDVGCGDGSYLIGKKNKGYCCYGVDISQDALEKIKQAVPDIHTFRGNVWDAGFSDDFFDQINLCNVLEHVNAIDVFMTEIRRILKPGGTVRVQVPNSASSTFKIFGRCWLPLDVPRHVYVFSKKNLRLFFIKMGFRIDHCRTIENSYNVIGSSIYRINEVFHKRYAMPQLQKVWDSELLKVALFPYAFFVNLLHIGDNVEFILKKN